MKRKISVVLVLCILTSMLSSCGCRHEWREADCTAPKTCTKCGEIKGEALEHTPGEWKLTFTHEASGKEVYAQTCMVCGEVLDARFTEAAESFIEDGKFTFTPNEFSDRVESISDFMEDSGEYSYDLSLFSLTGIGFAHTVEEEGHGEIALIQYSDFWRLRNDNFMKDGKEDDHGVDAIVVDFYTQDVAQVRRFAQVLLLACDPSITTLDESLELLKNIAQTNSDATNIYSLTPYTHNDINYYLYKQNDEFRFVIDCA